MVSGRLFRLTDSNWEMDQGILTGTMWRVRQQNLPSMLVAGRMEQVGTDLAESASFAYMPARDEALVQYNHHGPRHSIVSAFLERIGITGPVTLTPVIRPDAVQRMRQAALVRRIEYALGDIHGNDEATLRGIGLGAVIDELRTMRGTSIRVEISLGHDPGGLADRAKQLVASLSEVVTGVKAVKVGIKEGEDTATEMLDLLGGRLFIDLNVPEAGRELDRSVCRDRLRQALRDRQVTSEESDDDDGPEAAAAAEQ